MPRPIHWLLRILILGFGALILTGIGFMAGTRYGLHQFFDMLQTSDAAELGLNVDVLARYRVDGAVPALESMERRVDHAIINLALPLEMQKLSFDDLPPATRNVLQSAKIYRTAFPPAKNADLQLIQALEKIPLPPVRTDAGVDSALMRIRLQLAEQASTRPAPASATAPTP